MSAARAPAHRFASVAGPLPGAPPTGAARRTRLTWLPSCVPRGAAGDGPVRRRGRLVRLKNAKRRTRPAPFRCLAERTAPPSRSERRPRPRAWLCSVDSSEAPGFRRTDSRPTGASGRTDWPLCRAQRGAAHTTAATRRGVRDVGQHRAPGFPKPGAHAHDRFGRAHSWRVDITPWRTQRSRVTPLRPAERRRSSTRRAGAGRNTKPRLRLLGSEPNTPGQVTAAPPGLRTWTPC
jgi:hypothetical protein